MPKATSSTQAKSSTPTPQSGNRWNMSRWNIVNSGTKGVTLFEALGITKGTVHYPVFRASLPSQVAASQNSKGGASGGGAGNPAGTSAKSNQALGQRMAAAAGWTGAQWTALNNIVMAESDWSTTASNPSGAYGIPQALPGSKMASAGANWRTSAATQIKWMLGYIKSTYGNPVNAWNFHLAHGWY